jgi:hypothetical protein
LRDEIERFGRLVAIPYDVDATVAQRGDHPLRDVRRSFHRRTRIALEIEPEHGPVLGNRAAEDVDELRLPMRVDRPFARNDRHDASSLEHREAFLERVQGAPLAPLRPRPHGVGRHEELSGHADFAQQCCGGPVAQ